MPCACLSRRRFLALGAAAPLAACDGPPDLVSDEEVTRMGLHAWSEIRAVVPLTRDAAFAGTLGEVSARLLRAAGEAPGDWEVVGFASEQVNAFVLPGRKIGVYEGLWRVAGGPDSLAAVIGHEIGHLEADHAQERMSAEKAGGIFQRVTRFALRQADIEFSDEIAAALGLGLTYGVLLPYSRRQELEADALGLRHMARAGFDPAQAAAFWRRMDARGSRVPALLATHPAPADRIEAIEEMIPELRQL